MRLESASTSLTDCGLYVIWQNSHPHRVVRVGQGIIYSRISEHRSDRSILAHANPGLLVSWARAEERHWDGIERFLADRYNPLVGDRFPNCAPIPVNVIE